MGIDKFKENEKLFEDFYNNYFHLIFNYIYKNIFDKESTEDIISNTFYKAYKYFIEKKPVLINPYSWILKIAHNEMLMYLRHKGKIKIISIDDENNVMIKKNLTNEDAKENKDIDANDDVIKLRKILDCMKPVERMIIHLHFFEKKGYSEISKMLNMRENTLRSKANRIIKRIRKYFL